MPIWSPSILDIPDPEVETFYEGDTINVIVTAEPDEVGDSVIGYSIVLNEIPVHSGISVVATATEVTISGTTANFVGTTNIYYSIGDDLDTLYLVHSVDDVPNDVNLINYEASTLVSESYDLTIRVTIDEAGIENDYDKNYIFTAHNNWDGDVNALNFLMDNKNTA